MHSTLALRAPTSDLRSRLLVAASLNWLDASPICWKSDAFSPLNCSTCSSRSLKCACFRRLDRRADSLFETILQSQLKSSVHIFLSSLSYKHTMVVPFDAFGVVGGIIVVLVDVFVFVRLLTVNYITRSSDNIFYLLCLDILSRSVSSQS